MTETAFWKRPAAALLAELGTPDSGLTSREAALRLLRYGSNDAAAPSVHRRGFDSSGSLPIRWLSSCW